MQPRRGDVVRSSDPFKLGANSQRPWLIVNNNSHPFSIALDSDLWDVGGVPEESFVSPWAVHSPRIEDLVAWQGRVTDEFVESVVEDVIAYLR